MQAVWRVRSGMVSPNTPAWAGGNGCDHAHAAQIINTCCGQVLQGFQQPLAIAHLIDEHHNPGLRLDLLGHTAQ